MFTAACWLSKWRSNEADFSFAADDSNRQTDRRLLTLFSLLVIANQKLPFTMDPEYQAATRAYMRYHNMNPIFGISSQRQRNIDG